MCFGFFFSRTLAVNSISDPFALFASEHVASILALFSVTKNPICRVFNLPSAVKLTQVGIANNAAIDIDRFSQMGAPEHGR